MDNKDEWIEYKSQLIKYSRHKSSTKMHTLDVSEYGICLQECAEEQIVVDDCDLVDLIKYEEWLEERN